MGSRLACRVAGYTLGLRVAGGARLAVYPRPVPVTADPPGCGVAFWRFPFVTALAVVVVDHGVAHVAGFICFCACQVPSVFA